MSRNAGKVTLAVEGMDCNNCAIGISKSLKKKGLEDVHVDFALGEASFVLRDKGRLPEIVKHIHELGYSVISSGESKKQTLFSSIETKFYFSAFFTVPLFFSHMFAGHDFILNQPFVQMIICLPVFILGVLHFGKSAWKSLRAGVPNMDVLIFTGTTAAFFYSIAGMVLHSGSHEVHNYLFFETSATIITLVLLGNVFEHRSVKQTTTALRELTAIQPSTAKRLSLSQGKEVAEEIPVSEVKAGDLLLVNSGDKIPVDGNIYEGNGTVDQSMLTGESLPSEKDKGEEVSGGTILLSGSIKIRATRVGSATTLSSIIEMVRNASHSSPKIQKLGDRISAIFVPVVIGISIITFLINYLVIDLGTQKSIMNAIAVLVISCPCAMGLATPTAVMVGIGRAAKRGILIRGGSTLEEFSAIKTIFFDKTGTLTTGKFKIKNINLHSISRAEAVSLLYNLELNSSHPIAASITNELKSEAHAISLSNIKEEKGSGIHSIYNGKEIFAGSFRAVKDLISDNSHQVYLLVDKKIAATVDLEDDIKPFVKNTVELFNKYHVSTVMVSGDQKAACETVAEKAGIKNLFAEQMPADKLNLISKANETGLTAMIGDGINDSPSLAAATVGISHGDATQVAIRSSKVVLLNSNDLSQLSEAYLISRETMKTIKQNLFWAFFYNIVAIPIAAAGFLSPMIAALTMAFSDVIVIGNSLRLKFKKLPVK